MKKNPEFDKFTDFMDKLAKVPHDELKAELDVEKQKKELKESDTPPVKIEPKPMGTPEEVNAWADTVAKETVQGMRSRPKNFQVPY